MRHFRVFGIRAGMQTNYIKAYFIICVGIIAVPFENHSIHIFTAGVHKFLATLSCTLALNIFGSSVWNIFHFDILVEWVLMCPLHLCKIYKSLFYTVCNRIHINVGIIIRLCLLIDIYYIYPTEHNTFTVYIRLFSTACFGRLYRLKSGRVATMQRKGLLKSMPLFYSYVFLYIFNSL